MKQTNTMSIQELNALLNGKSKRNKYGVSAPADRTWNGKTYASRAEMKEAQGLDMLVKAGEIVCVFEQVSLWLGVRELKYVADFLVVPKSGLPYLIDRKGMETPQFRKVLQLWQRFGPLDLHVHGSKSAKVYQAAGKKSEAA